MRKKIIFSLYKKEILDILRDRKTILMMIVVPLILYPLIFLGSVYLTSTILTASTSKSYWIGFENIRDEDAMVDFFETHKDEHDYSFIYLREGLSEQSADENLQDGSIDAYLVESVSQNRPYYEIRYMASEQDSQTAAGMVRDILDDYRDELRSRAIQEAGLDEEALMEPIAYQYTDLSTEEENAGYMVGMIVPFLLITSILMGALYPAIDTTAGEKERGTLETLLTLPVNNLELISAKFLATSTVAVAAALLNLLSMLLLGLYMLGSMKAVGSGGELDLLSYLPAVLVTLLCVLVFAMFASAVCLCSCIFARSFKEAQNYTTPVMLVFMIGGMAGMIPQLSLNGTTALIPVVNIAILITEIFRFHFELSQIAVVLLSNIAYTAVAVILMARLFSSENILFGDASGGIRLLENRKHMKKGQIPGMGDVILLFAVLLLVVLFAGGLAVLYWGLYGLILEQALILGCTLLYAWYIKADGRKLFHLQAPRPAAVVACLLLYAGGFILLQLMGEGVLKLFPDLSQANTEALVELWEGKPLWLLVIAIALMPAICEEAAFRGFLLGSLEHKFRPAVAIVWTGICFGLFHMSLLQFIMITPMGILFAYVVWKERSIVLTVMMHFLNNLLSLLLQQYQEEAAQLLPFLGAEELPLSTIFLLLALGITFFFAGLMLLRYKKGPKSEEQK